MVEACTDAGQTVKKAYRTLGVFRRIKASKKCVLRVADDVSIDQDDTVFLERVAKKKVNGVAKYKISTAKGRWVVVHYKWVAKVIGAYDDRDEDVAEEKWPRDGWVEAEDKKGLLGKKISFEKNVLVRGKVCSVLLQAKVEWCCQSRKDCKWCGIDMHPGQHEGQDADGEKLTWAPRMFANRSVTIIDSH